MGKKKSKSGFEYFVTYILPIIGLVLGIFYFFFQEVMNIEVDRLGVQLYTFKVLKIITIIVIISLVISLIFQIIHFTKKADKEKGRKKVGIIITFIVILLLICLCLFFNSRISNFTESDQDEGTTLSTDQESTELGTVDSGSDIAESMDDDLDSSDPSNESTDSNEDENISTLPSEDDQLPHEEESKVLQWNFDDTNGCISTDWVFWPVDAWEEKLKGNVIDGCVDYLNFGFEALPREGLSIIYFEPDGDIEFGISRKIPEDTKRVRIKIIWSRIDRGEGDIRFTVGFVNTADSELDGQYFYLQRNMNTYSPHLYISGQVFTEEIKYLGYSDSRGQKVIYINCDVKTKKKIDCTYKWDNQEKNFIQYFTDGWDSVYFGYEITTNGVMDIMIDELEIYRNKQMDYVIE